MKWFVSMLVWLVACISVTYAGTVQFTFGGTPVTLTTTANQDTFLTRLLTRENAARAARTPPDSPLTLEQYMRDVFMATLQGYKQQADGLEKVDFCTVFPMLTASQRNQITALGGGSSPCP